MYKKVRNAFITTILTWFLITPPAIAQSLSTITGDYVAGSGAGVYQQDAVTGHVVFEAEHADANISRSGHSWVNTSVSSPDNALQASPVYGEAQKDPGYSSTSPQLDYQVNFVQTGTHYVWVRGYADRSSNNSVHVGLDGAEVSTSKALNFPTSSAWAWVGGTGVARFDVTSPGVHTVNVWMREPGFRLEKLVVTSAVGYTPSGFGPAESPRGGGGIPTAAVPTFASAGGRFAGSVTVSLASATETASIYYTTDGSTPNSSSNIYSGPFTLTSTVTVRSIAIADGFNDSSVSSETYTSFFVMAHRGGADEAPENTLAAFSKALAIGASIEMDVRLSADDEIVVIHDDTVDRTTDGRGNVSDMTLTQLKTLDAGSHFDATYAGETIPELDEVFRLFGSQASSNAFMSIDTKVENATMYTALVSLLDQHNLFDRVFIEVSSDEVADTIRVIDARVQFAFFAPTSASIYAALGYPFYQQIHAPIGQSGRTDDVHAAGLALILMADTVSDWSQIKGVAIDGINTNNPGLLSELINNQPPNVTENVANFTRNTVDARLHGVHEIEIIGDPPTGNPFDIPVTVTFTPPSGDLHAVTVRAFYDGGILWKARVYVTETGNWSWSSSAQIGSLLDTQSGTFSAVSSTLPGMLRPHPANPKQLADGQGNTFLNISDTAYTLFSKDIPFNTFTKYVEHDALLGVTSLRAGGCGGYAGWRPTVPTRDGRYERSNWCWDNLDTTRFDLEKFQSTDSRLEWLLNNHPDIYVQLILYGKNSHVGTDWMAMSPMDRERIMSYQIARWGAWPQLFFLIVNDTVFDGKPLNQDMVREIGNYYAANDPWNHLISAGPKRRENNPFITQADLDQWHSYIHEEKYSDIDASKIDEYKEIPLHVYYGEDWYEQSIEAVEDPNNPDYYYRRIFWSALLSGGSAAYGGRYPVMHPYLDADSLLFEFGSKTFTNQLSGLDSAGRIIPILQSANIDLAQFVPDDSIVRSPVPVPPAGDAGPSRIQATRKVYSEVLAYLPNATAGELSGGLEVSVEDLSRLRASVDANRTPRIEVDLRYGTNTQYEVNWFNPATGAELPGPVTLGGGWTELTSPWTGNDAVVHLRTTDASLSPPSLSPISDIAVTEFESLTFTVTATDADGTQSVLSVKDLPVGASFSDHHDGSGTFRWRPDDTMVGIHSATFVAMDALDSTQSDSQTISIEVLDDNNPALQ